jgi:hypothetical protein
MRSLQPSKENTSKIKFINYFLFFFVSFALLDPDWIAYPDLDPETPLNPDQQHWKQVRSLKSIITIINFPKIFKTISAHTEKSRGSIF